MPKGFVEFVTMDRNAPHDIGPFLIRTIHSRTKLDVTADATGDATYTYDLRPAAPTRSGNDANFPYYALVTAYGGPIVAFAGDPTDDPIADQSNGKLVLDAQIALLPVKPGDLISLVNLDVS